MYVVFRSRPFNLPYGNLGVGAPKFLRVLVNEIATTLKT